MIYTVTLNPSLDYLVRTDALRPGALCRTQAEVLRPGGKGVIVSLMCAALGLPTRLADLGLTLEDDFTGVLAATEVNQELEHVPYPVTRERIWDAIVKLEAVSEACDVPAAPAPQVPRD